VPQALPSLPRSWPFVELPGYRDHPRLATYSDFPYEELPPVAWPDDGSLRWLRLEQPVRESLAEAKPFASRPATREALDDLVEGTGIALPPAFRTLIELDEPRARIRSCTDCYLDLGDVTIAVDDGGRLVHFLSDQQWVLHWLLYSGPDGSEAVVATDEPLGFEDGPRSVALDHDLVVCAESFAEFVYRFWIENEIWFNLTDERPLPDEQRRYAEHYLR
jgi:hypothetical protein